MTIRTALRKLYTAMCGGTTNKNTAGELINDIAENYMGGGGGSLPTPGAVGNVLTSTGDGWESAAPSGDDEFIIHGTLAVSGDIPTAITNLDKTSGEIVAAMEANKNVTMIVQTGGTDNTVVSLSCVYGVESTAVFSAFAFDAGSGTEIHMFVVVDSQGPYLFVSSMPRSMPSASADENGKVLGVENGAYALVDAKPLIVHGTISGITATITDQITIADIAEQAADGRTVYFDVTGDHGDIERHTLCGYVTNATGSGVSFMALTLIDDEQQVTRLAATYIILQHSETLGDTSAVFRKIIENV